MDIINGVLIQHSYCLYGWLYNVTYIAVWWWILEM